MKKLDVTEYRIPAGLSKPVTLALVADLHNEEYSLLLRRITEADPDAIVIAGDLIENTGDGGQNGLAFLRESSARFPVFYGLGNHEGVLTDEDTAVIRKTGCTLLNGAYAFFGPLVIGGAFEDARGSDENRKFLEDYCRQEGYHVLLSHRPELYPRFLHTYRIPLILSGHAHGGQVRIGHQGIFAPGQGFFPKYTEGIHKDPENGNRLLISRGLGNHVPLPRMWNNPELCIIRLGTEQESK